MRGKETDLPVKKTALSYLKPHRFLVFFAPGFKIIECVFELLIPFIVRFIIDDGLTEGGAHYRDEKFIFGYCALIFGFSVFGFLATMVTQLTTSHVTAEYSFALRNGLYTQILSCSPKQIEDYGRGKALNLVSNDAPAVTVGVQMFMRLLIRAPFLVLGSIVASFIVNVYAGFAVLGALTLCALVAFIILRATPRQYDVLQNGLDRISGLGEDGIVGARVVRAFNKEDVEIAEFQSQSEAYRKQGMKVARINALINPLTFAFINIAIILLLYFGSFALPTTGLSVGSIVAIVSFLTQSLTALIMFTRLVTSLSKAFASKKRIDAFFRIEPEIVSGPISDLEKADATAPVFELKGATLSFGGENPALSRVDFVVKEGETVGVIGGTGSGKSVLLSLLSRFMDANEGEVLFHGLPIKDLDLGLLRGQIATVSQKPQVFRGTLRDNLLLGREGVSEEEIAKASKDALCDEYFSHYADGLDHPIEENGQNLSGGQRQRLLIARALLSARPILFLDDATSALDYKSDKTVRENIAKRPNLTTVIVSQRATSIASCDRIYVLDQGKVVGVGKHESLLKSCPIYREIYEAQVDAR